MVTITTRPTDPSPSPFSGIRPGRLRSTSSIPLPTPSPKGSIQRSKPSSKQGLPAFHRLSDAHPFHHGKFSLSPDLPRPAGCHSETGQIFSRLCLSPAPHFLTSRHNNLYTTCRNIERNNNQKQQGSDRSAPPQNSGHWLQGVSSH